ncbi:MAG TPA: serine/threonine protein kinase [Micromonospora sp.]
MRLADAIRLVARARTDEELFGADDPRQRYRRLAAVLHPDHTGGADDAQRRAATAAFVTLTDRWRAYQAVTVNGHRLREPAHTGDLADLYQVGDDQLLKLPRDPANNDLMLREQVALRRIERDGDPRYLPYVPRLVEAFRHRDRTTGAEHRVSVLATVPGLHSLAEVMRRRPGGLDPRDAAWMWRRLLVALGLAHRAGVVHGAVLPDHVLIEPAAHGVVLVDWCYSVVDPGDTVPALVPAFADWYPPEVRQRRPPGPGTDIAMATQCMTALVGADLPRALRTFADGCAQPRLDARPDDAWRLLGELDEVLERLYGPRTFRPFHL